MRNLQHIFIRLEAGFRQHRSTENQINYVPIDHVQENTDTSLLCKAAKDI
uniref:Uncharacterized protein n=1 Tax=Arion vulgaris TaxID=1028688 RepID=A0A0B7A0C1_9EUPU